MTRFPPPPRYSFYAVLISFFDRYPIQRARQESETRVGTTNNLSTMEMEKTRVLEGKESVLLRKRKKKKKGAFQGKRRFFKDLSSPIRISALLLTLLPKNNEIIQRLIVETSHESNHNANPLAASTLVNHSFNWLFFQLSNILSRPRLLSRRRAGSSPAIHACESFKLDGEHERKLLLSLEHEEEDIPLFFFFS